MNLQAIATTGATPADLSARTMLADLTIRQWSGRKLDKRVTAKVNAEHGAARDAGRYHKALVAKDALAEIATIVAAARADHATLTLPWLREGARIMPADAFGRYTATMRGHRERFESAVAAFVAAYPAMVEDARARLNGMFNPADYPAPATIAERFGWNVRILPMPSADDFRVNLSADQAAAVRADIENTMRDAMRDAMGDAYKRLHDVARAMADRLADYKPASNGHKASGVFRDTLVGNVRELVEILPLLNVTGDARLADMTDKARAALCQHDADTLRDDADARKETAKAAADIADAMAGFMGA